MCVWVRNRYLIITETHSVAMTDPQLANSNHNGNNNGNGGGGSSNNDHSQFNHGAVKGANTTGNGTSTSSNNGSSIHNPNTTTTTTITITNTTTTTTTTTTNNNNNNNNTANNNNNNNDGEPKYLHKKFKKMATSEVANETVHDETPLLAKEALLELGPEAASSGKSGKVCPYCKLSCAKPSVLLKHIRAHTNERPYPCVPCGFAFKTKSNLYKHCRSRAHAIKADNSEPAKVQLSEDSDVSMSDSASNGTGTPPPSAQAQRPASSPSPSSGVGARAVKIYKPKFHTVLQQCVEPSPPTRPNAVQLQEHIECIISDNQAIVEASDPRLHKLLHRQQSLAEPTARAAERRKRCRSEGAPENPERDVVSPPGPLVASGPLPSPGPLLGTTRLVQEPKRPRLEEQALPRPNARLAVLQMFGGEVRILDGSGASKTVRIEPRGSPAESIPSQPGPELASVVVRSGLHSGGTILHKTAGPPAPAEPTRACLTLTGIAPHIAPPRLAPSLGYLKPGSILHAGRLIPYVPGMPGPQSLGPPLDLAVEPNLLSCSDAPPAAEVRCRSPEQAPASKFLRPSSLPLKPGTFTPKRHHGITPTANTLPLISPETPRPKKSYGQLYLNGHAYTYLGLKCSTRLFYCTLNRPQPMYVMQQLGLSMYSNWKICKEAPSELELAHYDSRHRPHGYTLASSCHEGILTHSTQRPSTPSSPDSGLESDSQDRRHQARVKIFDGGFESNEDYTYIRGRGRGRYVCEECGIRCKKPSMLKKHIRTHTDVRPFTCKHCAFSFKTKGNLTKHMKSKAHYKKCVELKVLPVPTSVCDDNIDKEALSRLALAGACTDDTSSSEEESEGEGDAEAESDESDSEEHEAAQGLLSLAQPSASRLPGLLSSARPATYPYGRSLLSAPEGSGLSPQPSPLPATQRYCHGPSPTLLPGNESRLSVIRSCRRDEPAAPIDLTVKQQSDPRQRGSPGEILKGVTGPALLQTIVQTIERLPIQGRAPACEPPAEGRMLQAYLTERHMMNSKMKQLYRMNSIEQPERLERPERPERLDGSPRVESPPTKPAYKSHAEPPELELHADREQLHPSGQVLAPTPHPLSAEAVKHPLQPPLPQPPPPPAPSAQPLPSPAPAAKQQPTPTARKVVVGSNGFSTLSSSTHGDAHTTKPGPEFFKPSSNSVANYVGMAEDSRNVCNICNKVFSKPSQLRLHINIHYFERPFRCESCGTSFRTKGHLSKHERSTLHHNKVSMTSTFGAATASNPRPFKCTDCLSAFRIHGHLAKHLRSKMHIMKLECLRKLPFGTYAEMERSGVNLNDIDTTDCDTSLTSLQIMAQKLCEKDPEKLGQWEPGMIPNHAASSGETSSDEADANPMRSVTQSNEANISRNYHMSECGKPSHANTIDVRIDEVKTGSIYNCQLCPMPHCFVDHNMESSNTSAVYPSHLKEKIKEKENIHHLKGLDDCTIKESESGQRIDTT